MTYGKRISILFLADSLSILAAVFIGVLLVDYKQLIPIEMLLLIFFFLFVCYHFSSYIFNLYKKVWAYASVGEVLILLKTVGLSVLLAGIVQYLATGSLYFRHLAIISMLQFLFIGAFRFYWRFSQNKKAVQNKDKIRTLIVGAGQAGTMVARQLLLSPDCNLLPVAFIDDDRKKHRLHILGIPVSGGRKDIARVVQQYGVDQIVIAIPSLPQEQMQEIIQLCVKTGKKTMKVPRLEDIVSGTVSASDFRDVQAEDLLGREEADLDHEAIANYLKNKTVFITGAGGSIGSEICRQVCQYDPKTMILMGHGENSIYEIKMELEERFGGKAIEFIPEIADIKDREKMMFLMEKYRPDVVYHAAAHKHVPLMERNPEEALKNNVIGTMNVAQAASWHNAEVFIMVSTDKAVNPTSVMGATKRLAEMAIRDLNRQSQTRFAAVRFGNVLGSRGSVIPLFKRQIERGGPVTVTHPDMVRYFMTIPEAARLVLQAGALAKGGEIFVLNMGDPVKIVDLAKNLILLSGHSIEEIGIEFTGIRPGEKLYEELLSENEVQSEQVYPNIYVGLASDEDMEAVKKLIEDFPLLNRKELKERILFLANKKEKREEMAAL